MHRGIHRVAAGPSSQHALPYAPPVDAQGKLFCTIEGHIEPYCRPAWDGVAYLQFASMEDLQSMLGAQRVINKIQPEDKALFNKLAPLLARQTVLIDGKSDGVAVFYSRLYERGGRVLVIEGVFRTCCGRAGTLSCR